MTLPPREEGKGGKTREERGRVGQLCAGRLEGMGSRAQGKGQPGMERGGPLSKRDVDVASLVVEHGL